MNAWRRKLGVLVASFALASLLIPAKCRAAEGEADDAASPTAKAHELAKGDVLLESLLAELDRSRDQLKMDGVKPPYYIEYRVDDVDNLDTEASFGALLGSQRAHVRVLRVVVRIGDYKQDSFYGQGTGGATIVPLDNDPIALRRQIWLMTDEAYKAAADAYAEKLSALKQFTADPNPVDDFAKAPVLTRIEPVASQQLDENYWKQTLTEITNLYRKYPEIQSVSASARFRCVNQYFVNSEGTIVREGRTNATVTLSGGTQATDGMRLARSPYWTEVRAEDLPKREALLKETTQMLDTLKALRNAPIVEESYRGPVMFTPDASDDILSALVGANILGRKPQLGKPNRTTGAFATSYKTRVLPKFMSVVDDPTLKAFGGKNLVGSYDVDSEGVAAQSVNVVVDGSLENYLTNREPLRDFPTSNGHGRAAPGTSASPAVGTLIFKSSEAQSPADLTKKLKEMAGAEDKAYGYRVDTLGPGNAPRLLYRIYASDGHEELVRGAVFNELDVRALRNDLTALGNDPLVSNRVGGLAETIIAPSLLFDELEVKRADTSKEKLPEYPAPELRKP